MSDPRFIGLSGYAGSGKDTIADILIERGYERITFAGKLRDAVYAFDPIVDISSDGELMRLSSFKGMTYQEQKDNLPEFRRALQTMGTEVGRNIFGENFWVDIAFANLDVNQKYVITDARFPNEYDAVMARAGRMWRVSRPGFGPINDHPSETSLDEHNFNWHVINDSDIPTLSEKVHKFLDQSK